MDLRILMFSTNRWATEDSNVLTNIALKNVNTSQQKVKNIWRHEIIFYFYLELVNVNLPNGVLHTFNLDSGAGRQSVNMFLKNSVLPTATSSFELN